MYLFEELIPAGLARFLALFGPFVLASALWLVRPPTPRLAAAILLATLWQLPALLAIHVLAERAGWWRFHAEGGLFMGLPVDLYLGWAVLWGVLPGLLLNDPPRAPLTVICGTLVLVDAAVMPTFASVLTLGPDWLVGEAVAVLLALVPAMSLLRWTLEGRFLFLRAGLQVVLFAALSLFVLPAVALSRPGGGWQSLGERLRHLDLTTGLLLGLALSSSALGLWAVVEFAARGQGTPFPYDPPKRLVTTGPYAVVANPMQVSMCLLIPVWGALLRSWEVAAGGVLAVAFSAGLAAWREAVDLRERFGEDYSAYRSRVRPWIPRFKRVPM